MIKGIASSGCDRLAQGVLTLRRLGFQNSTTINPPPMTSVISSLIASIVDPVSVPDSGMTAVLVSGSVLSLGLVARYLKNRKK